MPDGRLRRAWALTLDGSTTSAAPVSPDGTVRLRSNADGTAIEVSYDGAAYTTLSGSAGSWSALTAPTADLTLAHGDYKTIFNFDATEAEDCFTIQSANNAAGSGVVFHVATQGASTNKAPLRVDAKGSVALVVDVNGRVGVGVDASHAWFEVQGDAYYNYAATPTIEIITGISSVTQSTPSSGSLSNKVYGLNVSSEMVSNSTQGSIYGGYVSAITTGTGARPSLTGLYSSVRGDATASGNVSEATAFYASMQGGHTGNWTNAYMFRGDAAWNDASAGTLGAMYGLHLSMAQSTGTVTLYEGVHIVAPTGSYGTKRGVVVESGAGNSGFGTSAPVSLVHIGTGDGSTYDPPSGVATPTCLYIADGTSGTPSTSTSPAASIIRRWNATAVAGSAGALYIDLTNDKASQATLETLSVRSRNNQTVDGDYIGIASRMIAEGAPGTGTSMFAMWALAQKLTRVDAGAAEYAFDNQYSRTISAASNATPIEITVTFAHYLTTGDEVYIAGVGGNTAANGTMWTVTVVNATKFTLDTSVGNGAYTSGGTVYLHNARDYGTAGNRGYAASYFLGAGNSYGNATAILVIGSGDPTRTQGYTGIDIRPDSISPLTHRAIRMPNTDYLSSWNADDSASYHLIGLAVGNTVSLDPNGRTVYAGTGPTQITNADGTLRVAAFDSAVASPAGSGSELQCRGSSTTLAAVSNSSVNGGDIILGGTLAQTTAKTTTSATTVEWLDQNATIAPGSTSSTTHYLFSQSALFTTAQAIGHIRMRYAAANHNQAVNVSSYYDTESVFTKSASGTVTVAGGSTFTANVSAGTVTQLTGSLTQLATGGGTITAGVGFSALADNSGGTFTSYTAYKAFQSGTIGTAYGFISNAGFLNGFGTLTPLAAVHIDGGNFIQNAATNIQAQQSIYTWGTSGPLFVFHRSLGTQASATAVTASTPLGQIRFNGNYDTTSITLGDEATATSVNQIGAIIMVEASANWNATDNPADIRFRTGTTVGVSRANAMIITSDRRTVVGDAVVHADATKEFNVKGSWDAFSDSGSVCGIRAYGSGSAQLHLFRGRGTTASPSAVLNSDSLGQIIFGGSYDGTTGLGSAFNDAARIWAEAQNDWASLNWPADLILQTKPVSGLSVRTTMRLTSGQRCGIGDNITHSAITHRLFVDGDARFTGQVQFSPTATLAGLNVGSVTGDPSSLVDGDIWYDSTGHTLDARINGATVSLGASAGANTALSNLASVSINASLIPQTTLDLGAAATAWRNLYIYGAGTYGSTSLKFHGTPTGNRVLTFPDATDTIAALGQVQTWTQAQTLAANATLGAAAGTTGALTFKGTTSGTVVLTVAAAAGTTTFTLPTSGGSSGQYLQTNGSGTLSWQTVSGGTPGGSGSEIQYRSGSSTFGAVTGSSVSAGAITLTEVLTITQDAANTSVRGYAFAANSTGSAYLLAKGRGTAASPAAVQSGDSLGTINWAGQYDTTAGHMATAALIGAEAAANFTASNNVATDIICYTRPASAAANHIALRLTSDQYAGIGYDISHAEVTHRLTVIDAVAGTNVVGAMACWQADSSGTPATGFGARHVYQLDSATVEARDAAYMDWRWQDATDASRSAVYSVKTTANAVTKERMLLGGYKSLTDATATDLFSVVFAAAEQKAAGGIVIITCIAKKADTTDTHAITETVAWTAGHWNGSSSINVGLVTGSSKAVGASGAYALTYSTSGGGTDTLTFRVSADTTLNVATEIYFQVIYGGDAEVTLA